MEQIREENRKWLLGEFVGARTLYHGLTADGDLPLTKAEQKKPTPDFKIKKAKKARLKHDQEWLDALSDPRVFGKMMGMVDILGEPPERPKPEDEKEQKKAAFEGFKKRFSAAMREHRR